MAFVTSPFLSLIKLKPIFMWFILQIVNELTFYDVHLTHFLLGNQALAFVGNVHYGCNMGSFVLVVALSGLKNGVVNLPLPFLKKLVFVFQSFLLPRHFLSIVLGLDIVHNLLETIKI